MKMKCPLFSLALALVTAVGGASAFAGDQVTLESLLDEMADPDAVTRLPAPAYRIRGWSSRDRRSVRPGNFDWFANGDFNQFLPGHGSEKTIVSAQGPGAIVRVWCAGVNITNGILRVYLDDAFEPVFAGLMTDIVGGTALCGAPLSFTCAGDPAHNPWQRGQNLILPIPFAKSCRMTFEPQVAGCRLWYNVEARAYAEGTAVETVTAESFKKAAGVIAAANARLARPAPFVAKVRESFDGELPPGERLGVQLTYGPASRAGHAVRNLAFRFDGSAKGALPAAEALGKVWVEATFDGEKTLSMPAGVFMGTGPWELSPYRTRVSSADSLGLLGCRRTMPFRRTCEILLVNRSNRPVRVVESAAEVGDYDWIEGRSMHLSAKYVARRGIRSSEDGNEYDLNFDVLSGAGMLVGTSVFVSNPSDFRPCSWWGEGDEKIWVDGEGFPSVFGTGTEDYFNYAWSRPESFSWPFCAQPSGAGNLAPGKSSNLRWRALDAIPFARSLRFDMEMWHWDKNCLMDYDSVSWRYRMPLTGFDITDYGAVADPSAENHEAIQRAIDAAAAEGGGTVRVPAGVWNSGTIRLKSNVELHLEKGAVIRGSTRAADYNADDEFPENFWSVGEEWSGSHLILGYKVENVAITGEGVIDGNGGAFFDDCQYNWHFPHYKYGIKLFPKDRSWFRPGPMVAFFLSKNIRLEGVTLANTPGWTCHVRCSDGFAAKGVTIDADRTIANSDGFSIDCTRNVKIADCTIRTGDDGFAIRASCRHHAAENICENIVVTNCDVWSCCFGVRFGVGTGTIRNASFEDCRFHESSQGVGYTPAWVNAARNVYIEGTSFRRCSFLECERPVAVWPPKADARVRDALFEDCEMASLLPSSIWKTEQAPVEGVRFVRCHRKALLDGVKVRQDDSWLTQKKREIRREADLFAVGNADVKLVDCSPVRGEEKGVLLLTFDDRNFDDWVGAVPLFDRYGAHATFFVSGGIDNGVVRKLKTLRAHGHSIGLHGLNHANADEAVAAKGAEAYLDEEIHPQSRVCGVCYVPVSSFAYPNCRRNDVTDRLLVGDGFDRVRGGVAGATPYDPDGVRQTNRTSLVTNDAVYFPASELAKRRRIDTILVGEAYHTDIDEILDCLRRIAKRREVMCITSHGIGRDAKYINMKTEWLEEILKTAKELDLRVVGFDELPCDFD